MNILYIGPYKHNRCLSYASQDIIDSLNNHSQISRLTIRPIFLPNDPTIPQNFIISNLENAELSDEYDCIIQHANIDTLCDMSHLCKKNIAIPIIENTINKESYYKQLESFDMVLVDSIEYQNLLSQDYGMSNVKIFGYSKMYNTVNNIINFYHHNSNTKIYSIDRYDPAIFDKLITSFLLAFHDQDNISLMLFFNQDQSDITENLNQRLEQIYKNLNILSDTHNINILVKTFSIEELSAIHKSCQVYISLSSSNIESSLNSHMAKQYGNKIICGSDITTVNIPNNQNYLFPEETKSVTTMSLSNKMMLVTQTNQTPEAFHPSIADIICQ
jgi:hypothetical protein